MVAPLKNLSFDRFAAFVILTAWKINVLNRGGVRCSSRRVSSVKLWGAIAIIGALNWGLVGAFKINLVAQFFGEMTRVSRIIYILVGLSGLVLLASYFKACPGLNVPALKVSLVLPESE